MLHLYGLWIGLFAWLVAVDHLGPHYPCILLTVKVLTCMLDYED